MRLRIPDQWRFPLRALVRFVVSALLVFVGERMLGDRAKPGESITNDAIFSAANFYHALVTSTPRRSHQGSTVLVYLGDGTPATQPGRSGTWPDSGHTPPNASIHTICEQRALTGHLLQRIMLAAPKAIVLDKTYLPGSCALDSPAMQEFRAGVQSACSRLLVGRAFPTEVPDDQPLAFVQVPALDFQSFAGCPVREANVNIDQDHRHVALWWGAGVLKKPVPTLANAAVRMYDPHLLSRNRMALSDPTHEPPYVSFLSPAEFRKSLSAITILCGEAKDRYNEWRSCTPDLFPQSAKDLIAGKVVIIGDDHPGIDRHSTVVGDVPGVMLQANYIESLIDDRVALPVADWLNLFLGFLIFASFEFILWRHHGHLANIAKWLLILFGGTALLIYLAFTIGGYYLNPVTVSTVAITSKLIETLTRPNTPRPSEETPIEGRSDAPNPDTLLISERNK